MKRTVAAALILLIIAASIVFVAVPVSGDPYLWSDDFNDGNYNGWTVYSGTWSVVSGKLHGQGGLSPIYTNTAFSSDRTVQSELRTETAGGAPYDVAVLMVKWVNMQNQICVRLFTDGRIELIMWKNGINVHSTLVSTNLDPYATHMFTVTVSGINIKVWIDGELNPRIDVNDSDFDDIAGSVGHQTSASCYFDDMKVWNIQSPGIGLYVYAYDNYGRPQNAQVYIDYRYRGQANTGEFWSLSSGSHLVSVNVPSGNVFHRFISNDLAALTPVYYTNNPTSVLVQMPMTLTAYYNTTNPPQPQGFDTGGGRASVLYSTDWLMLSKDLSEVSTAFSSMYEQFDANSIYHHLWNYKSKTTWNGVRSQIQDCESHDWATVFYYGHMNLTSIGNPPVPSYGIRVQANPADQNPADVIWDTDVKPYTNTGKHHFVFLWVCNNGNLAGSSWPTDHGAPYCWTDQENLASHDEDLPYLEWPFTDPVHPTYCFIGFEGASPTLMDGMGTYYETENTYRNWLVFFYYYALNGYNVNSALHLASQAVNLQYGWEDPANRLRTGYIYAWSGGDWLQFGHFEGRMRIYGNGGISL